MATLLYHQIVKSDMKAPIKEPPKEVVGSFGVMALQGTYYTAFIAPQDNKVGGYTYAVAYYPDPDAIKNYLSKGGGEEPNLEWGWNSEETRVVTFQETKSDDEAKQMGGRYFRVTVPAGQKFGYIQIRDILNGGSLAFSMWRSAP